MQSILLTAFFIGAIGAVKRISLKQPSGLFLTKTPPLRCLLQYNCIALREEYREVYEYRDAMPTSTCNELIAKAETYAEANGGWTANRHDGYPTTDLPLDEIMGTRFSDVHGLVNAQILPELAKKFQLNEDFLRIGELFVAKYEFGENKQASLGAHRDGTPWSFVLSLNDPEIDFAGGGTIFTESNSLYRAQEAGTAFLFSGFINYINPDVSHDEFLRLYDAKYDGNAAVCEIQTGDILRGIVSETGEIFEFGNLVTSEAQEEALRRLGSELQRCGFCDVLIERDDEVNDAREATKAMSSILLSTGKYWALDEYLDS